MRFDHLRKEIRDVRYDESVHYHRLTRAEQRARHVDRGNHFDGFMVGNMNESERRCSLHCLRTDLYAAVLSAHTLYPFVRYERVQHRMHFVEICEDMK